LARRIYPIFEDKYIQKLKKVDIESRLEIALNYIYDVAFVFLKYAKKGDGIALVDITLQGQKGWNKICKKDIVVKIDEEGYEYILESQTFPDYLLDMFVKTSKNEKDYNHAIGALTKIFNHHKWQYTKPLSWKDYKLEQESVKEELDGNISI
jgi:hypothetical protein